MGKIYLSPLVDIVVKNNKIYMCEDDIYTIDCENNMSEAIEMIRNGCEESDIYSVIGVEMGKSLIESLKDMGFIKVSIDNKFKETMVEKQIEYLYSLTADGNKAQEDIQNKKICIIGVEGIGAVAIQHLVAAGVESFLLIDGDTVNVDNFNRQMIYKISQIGKKKVYTARDYIMEINPKAEVVCINKFIESENDLDILDDKKIDFIVCGADKPYNKIQIIVSNYCKRKNLPSIYANVGINIGNWGPLIVPSKDISYEEYLRKLQNKMNEDELVISTAKRQPLSASFGITNTIIGAYMSFEIIKYLIGVNTKPGVVFALNFLNHEIREENINTL